MDIDIKKYIKNGPIKNPETQEYEIFLHKLPQDERFFEEIWRLREEYKEETFIITEEIKITGKTVDIPYVNLFNCIFEGPVNFNRTIFEGRFRFYNVIFKKSVEFKKCRFYNQTDFYTVTFEDSVWFDNTIFEGAVTFKKSIKLKKGGVSFCAVTFKDLADFDHVNFGRLVFFSNTTFEKEVYFSNTTFYKNRFSNTTFKNLSNFYKATFVEEQQFISTNFLGKVIFTMAIFEKEVQFLYCNVESNSFISFQNAKFHKAIDISRSNFYCNLNFFGIDVRGLKEAYQSEKYKNDFGENLIEPSVYAKLRESFRIMKNSCIKENNKIGELEFYEKEMNVYLEELRKEKTESIIGIIIGTILINFILMYFIPNFSIAFCIIFNVIIGVYTLEEEGILRINMNWILLLFNKISNNFGTSWVQGLIFTCIVTLATYFVLIFPLFIEDKIIFNPESKYIGDFMENFIRLLNITEWKDFKLFGQEIKGFSYLFLFIGRIFISYGYYQTIQAFRKYGK